MYDYDEEFFYEPSEFEAKIDEFKQSLLDVVRTDYKTEMERLRTENAELQEVKKNFEQIKNDYKHKEQQLQYDRNNMEQKIRGARLAELMKNLEVTLYRADYKTVLGNKCDKCNSNRQIEFIAPSGKTMAEPCECATKKIVYRPGEQILKEFRTYRNNDRELIAWYSQYQDDGEGFTLNSSTVVKVIYSDGMNFSDLERYSTFFRSEEDCQKYCDWLTEKEENKTVSAPVAKKEKTS